MDSARPEAADRSTSKRDTRREDGGHLRDDRWIDVCKRLEGGSQRASVRRLVSLPIPKHQRPTTPNFQVPITFNWELGVGRGWALGVGPWEIDYFTYQ